MYVHNGFSDQTAQKRRLICVFLWSTCQKVRFHTLRRNLLLTELNRIELLLCLQQLFYNTYSETCVSKPPLWLTLVVDMERWLSYKGICHVILLAKLYDMYLYKADVFSHQALFKVSLKGGSLITGFTVHVCNLELYKNKGWGFVRIKLF